MLVDEMRQTRIESRQTGALNSRVYAIYDVKDCGLH
jgi:hypothetical protein